MPIFMQAFTVFPPDDPYNATMPAGRPPKHERSPFGERLHAARLAAGLSQAHVAEQMGVTQPSYADWERRTVALPPEHLPKLAAILSISVEELLGSQKPKRGTGPVGKAKALFDRVSALPRDRQQRILTTVEDMLVAHETRKAG